jgi:hypothetical protein
LTFQSLSLIFPISKKIIKTFCHGHENYKNKNISKVRHEKQKKQGQK